MSPGTGGVVPGTGGAFPGIGLTLNLGIFGTMVTVAGLYSLGGVAKLVVFGTRVTVAGLYSLLGGVAKLVAMGCKVVPVGSANLKGVGEGIVSPPVATVTVLSAFTETCDVFPSLGAVFSGTRGKFLSMPSRVGKVFWEASIGVACIRVNA